MELETFLLCQPKTNLSQSRVFRPLVVLRWREGCRGFSRSPPLVFVCTLICLWFVGSSVCRQATCSLAGGFKATWGTSKAPQVWVHSCWCCGYFLFFTETYRWVLCTKTKWSFFLSASLLGSFLHFSVIWLAKMSTAVVKCIQAVRC